MQYCDLLHNIFYVTLGSVNSTSLFDVQIV